MSTINNWEKELRERVNMTTEIKIIEARDKELINKEEDIRITIINNSNSRHRTTSNMANKFIHSSSIRNNSLNTINNNTVINNIMVVAVVNSNNNTLHNNSSSKIGNNMLNLLIQCKI